MYGKLKIEVNKMNELIAFLTSKEIIVVYIIAGAACLLCFAVYLVEKNNEKFRRRHNTRELNKLVDQIKEETREKEQISSASYEKPDLEVLTTNNNAASVVEMLESTAEMQKFEEVKEEKNQTEVIKKVEVQKEVAEPVMVEPIIQEFKVEPIIEEAEELKQEKITPIEEKEVIIDKKDIIDSGEIKETELQYTSIEPDQATAKLELEKLTEELKKQEQLEENENIALTNYEEEQEENAIISLEELVKKSKEMYAANELSQYADEGNEPISLQDLEKQMGDVKAPSYDEPFIIENVVPEEELTSNIIEDSTKEIKETVALDDFNTVKIESNKEELTPIATNKKFQSSPIISPIYGIEKHEAVSSAELELENTANYDKLDEEIKKTNEFLMTLKELQKKLD